MFVTDVVGLVLGLQIHHEVLGITIMNNRSRKTDLKAFEVN